MKTIEYPDMAIQNFSRFYDFIHKTFDGILGGDWNKETKTLKIFYEDEATEIPIETLQNLQVPTILRFKKKLVPPDLDVPKTSIIMISENEFIVETFDAEAVRRKIREMKPEFKETSS